MPTLADALRGYQPPTTSALADPIVKHFRNLPQTTTQNLANQRQTIDSALQMTPQGMQIADQGAFNKFMGEVPNVAALTAWHGTPHKIQGAFDINKVGTGEGAQAYGHGMYFAENPAVAGEYARALAEKPKDVINGYINYSAKYGRPKGEGNTSLGYLQSQGFPIENAPLLDKIIAGANVDKQGNVNFSSNAIKELSNLESAMASKGNLYKVDIPDADIPMMLDYDKPLKTQINILENLLSKDSGFTGQTKREIQELVKNDAIGEDLVRLFGKDQVELSNELSKLGIKGIRYKDAMSRGADEGTSNFVVFDPSTVKILEENSKPVSRKELIQQQIDKIE